MRFNLDQSRIPDWQVVWSDWFAWRPVTTNDKKLVWLETVQRRKELVRYYGGYLTLPNTFRWEWVYK